MILRTGTFRCLAGLAVCLAASGCPNWNVRGRMRVANPPPAEPSPVIQSPPRPIAAAPVENKFFPVAKAADPKPIEQPPPANVEKQQPAGEEMPPAAALAKMRDIHGRASQRVRSMDCYSMRLKRREVVNGKKKPEEIMLVQFRKEPFSVHLKWEANQREAVYVKGRYDTKIHTRLAAGDVLLMPAGTRFSLAPDNPLVLANTRHPITEAGLGHVVEQFGLLLAALEKGDARLGTVKYLGVLKRPEIETPVEGFLQILPPGGDTLLPKGGQRLWFFDIQYYLPVLILTKDDNGQEVEFYCHDQLDYSVTLDDDAFNPDKLWGKK